MKNHILKLDTAGTNARGEATFAAGCTLRCWSGVLTRTEARRKQDEHVEAVAGVAAQNARSTVAAEGCEWVSARTGQRCGVEKENHGSVRTGGAHDFKVNAQNARERAS